MFEKNISAEVCNDMSVTKHTYRVRATHTMGPQVLDELIQAGSKAHAALLIGIKLITTLLEEGGADEISMHNIADHLTVDVELQV